MPPNSYNWAQIDIRRPNARVVTFGEFEIMAPKSKCPMLTCWGVTSIEALCQAAHPFGHLNFYNHTLYRLVAFRQMVHLFASITFGCLFLFINNTLGFHSFHPQRSILSEATLLPPQHNSLGMQFLLNPYFHGFFLCFFTFVLQNIKEFISKNSF